ncbi:MAG: hypothetical protein J6Y15_10080 [Bacteroidaceae bacterium]|nr:hypothetical protein [Bacteroidaceae bacterium]
MITLEDFESSRLQALDFMDICDKEEVDAVCNALCIAKEWAKTHPNPITKELTSNY